MYDPQVGRWITQDPAGFSSGDVNLYCYVANDATNAIDPTGLQAQEPSNEGGTVAKRGTFPFDEAGIKGTGTVTVIIDTIWKQPRTKAIPHSIALSFTADFPVDNNWHWIQGVHFQLFNDKGKERFGAPYCYPTYVIDEMGVKKTVWHYYGPDIMIDTLWTPSRGVQAAFADITSPLTRRGPRELTQGRRIKTWRLPGLLGGSPGRVRRPAVCF